MKISKEVWLVIAIVGFLLSYLIDRLAGPVAITIGNPVVFLTSYVILKQFPFTAVAVIIRSLAIFISITLSTLVVEKQYFNKAIALLFIGVLAEFYSIQQLANGFRMTTIQWTLAIAYGSALLILAVIAFILKGIWAMFNNEKTLATDSSEESDKESSILKPPTNH